MRDTQNNILPENADKILFAEDFMNHMLLRFELPLLPSKIADYRDFIIYNAFNAKVSLAANCAFEKLKEEMAKEFEDLLESITIDNMDNFFSNYAIALRNQTLELMRLNKSGSLYRRSFRQFMEFCVKISTLAGIFYVDGVRGFQDAPCIAVDNIISLINDIYMFKQRWWVISDIVAADYLRRFMHTADNSPTPSTSDSNSLTSSDLTDADTTHCSSSDTSNKDNSDDSRSPDHKMDVGDDQDEQPKPLIDGDFSEMCSSEDSRFPDHAMDVGVDQNEQPKELTDKDYCKICIAAMSSSPEGPASSSSICNHVEKTIEVKTENTVSISDNASDSVSSGSPKETSSEDDTFKEKIRKKKMKNLSK